MNPSQPLATHVAVANGGILGAGSLQQLQGWGEYQLDKQFEDKIIMPGFVEGHSHAMAGSLWDYIYVGYFDRMDPDGKIWSGCTTIAAVIERLQASAAKAKNTADPITGWALDPIYYENQRITRLHLDKVSTRQTIGLLHASIHIITVNSRVLEMLGLLRPGVNNPGIPLGEDGLPTGELKGPELMTLAAEHVGLKGDFLACDAAGLKKFGKLCVRTGVTTATDLAARLEEDGVKVLQRVTGQSQYPVRIVSLIFHGGRSPQDLVNRAVTIKQQSNDQLRIGMIKIVADGSIQGFSARLLAPGYFNGAPNGLWYIAPEQMQEIIDLSLQHDIQVHIHTNGDEATELLLDCMERALRTRPTPDHRFTIQHCQMANAAQFRRMAKLGMCVNLFANHHYYWGDEHYQLTLGPERAIRMNACATALRHQVPLAIHSDAPVTPLGPLFTAWCAINRITASGRVQGVAECIDLNAALFAITLGAAYTLKLDSEIGSIEAGKKADLAILEADPTLVDSGKIKDIPVWGTIQNGRIFAAADQ